MKRDPRRRKEPFRVVFALLIMSATGAATLRSAEPLGKADPVAIPTMGGKQFWADELFFHQWRIQRNVITGHYRLLDEQDRRHLSGTFEECRARLDQIKRTEHLPPMRGRAVIVLHGLGRSRVATDAICNYLKSQGGYTVFNVSYPSTQEGIADMARSLARVVENLDGITEINFVAHSMGNIVIRHYMADQAAAGRRPDPRIRRFVMLAPPNHGSLAALTFADNSVFRVVAGEAGQELGRDWAKLEAKLATPGCKFGIIAGGKGDNKGFNPLLPGDNDGTITVGTTRLEGAADFLVLPVMHTFIVRDAKALEYTLRFLEKGYFISPDKVQPVPKAK
jgi:pimeloyl-ACP methyl ester carboxylesterase